MSMGERSELKGWDYLDSRCYVDKGFVILDQLWDYTNSGYFPMSDPVSGSTPPSVRLIF